MTLLVRALRPADAGVYRALRLEALASVPEAFGSSYEEESAWPDAAFAERVSCTTASRVFGAFDGDALVGMAGFYAQERVKQRHKGLLWGVYVQPAFRGRTLGKRLVQAVIDEATRHVVVLQATVVTTNHAAREIYRRLGFIDYGIERRSLRVAGVFHDEALIARSLD